MRKTLIAAAVLAAGAFAYYKLSGAGKTAIPELDYVPADTVLFSGQFEPIDLTSYLSSVGLGPQYYSNPEVHATLAEMIGEGDDAQAKFVLSLIKNYLDVLSSSEDFVAKSGLKEKMRSLLYTVGMSPVSRLEVADKDAFLALFDRAEQESGFAHQLKNVEGVEYRQYRFVKDEIVLDFLVSVHNGWATLTLTSEKLHGGNVAELLAVTKPAKNLNSEKTLVKIADKYKLNKDALGFISFSEIGRSVTTTDGNRLARDLNTLFGAELADNLADWRTQACQQDVASITTSWPGIYFDGQFDYSKSDKVNVSSNLLVATENTNVVDALSALRGYLPPHQLNNSLSGMFHFGLGLDVVQLSSSVGKIWTEITEPTYSCQPLATVQRQLKQTNPVAVLAMAGMANGLQGMSVTVNNVVLDTETMAPSEIDALLTVSVANVRSFIEGMAMFYPALAQSGLPAVGEEVSLSEISPEAGYLGIDAKLKLTNDHLLIYAGEKANQQAQVVAKSALTKNGLVSFGMDYAAFFGALIQTMEATGQEVPADLAGLQETQMKLSLTVDVEKQGIVTKSSMELSGSGK